VSTKSLTGSESIEEVVAGFIVWLARQRAPVEVRHQAPSAVERFLRWGRDQRVRGRDDCEEAYHDELRARGAADPEITTSHEAIALLVGYRRAGR
jgi:hypothetical protein